MYSMMSIHMFSTSIVCTCVHSAFVKVKRQCLRRHQWTSVDFSGCTLSSDEDQAFFVVSLWTTMINADLDQALVVLSIPKLEDQVKQVVC